MTTKEKTQVEFKKIKREQNHELCVVCAVRRRDPRFPMCGVCKSRYNTAVAEAREKNGNNNLMLIHPTVWAFGGGKKKIIEEKQRIGVATLVSEAENLVQIEMATNGEVWRSDITKDIVAKFQELGGNVEDIKKECNAGCTIEEYVVDKAPALIHGLPKKIAEIQEILTDGLESFRSKFPPVTREDTVGEEKKNDSQLRVAV